MRKFPVSMAAAVLAVLLASSAQAATPDTAAAGTDRPAQQRARPSRAPAPVPVHVPVPDSVPSAETLAMALACLGALGLASRRRLRHA